ncbi:MAG: hypothetical protein IJP13_07430 [Lachnospiraceae bacterium]|nr:hypothetical protein [Lachnospiraceae bacterium]
MDFERRKRPFRYFGRVVDIINIIFSVLIFACALILFMNREENMLLFPAIFFCAAVINLAMGIKYYKRDEMGRFISLMVGFVFFVAVGIFATIVIL